MERIQLSINIKLVPFEPSYQEGALKLYKDVLNERTNEFGKTANAYLKWYTERIVSEERGDLFNIYENYIRKSEGDKPDCKNFWVAIDESKKAIIGLIGVIMSTYPQNDKFIYYSKELNPCNVCELVRMVVCKDYRGKYVGKRMLQTLEKFAMENGMKAIVLSTLDGNGPAGRFYTSVGFKVANKTKANVREELGPGDWEDLFIFHFIKVLQ